MNFADLLTYADIDHLKRMAFHYGCGGDDHSKNGLITSLLYHLGGSSRLKGEMECLDSAEFRFLQQLFFDSRSVFSREELLGKGRVSLTCDDEESPRDLVILGLRKGWLFPGVSGKNKTFFEIPDDLRRRFLKLFAEKYGGGSEEPVPAAYRNEEGLLAEDLGLFLRFLARQDVSLTMDGAIYRQQQKQILKCFHVSEEPVSGKGWRFGFGRRYHQYPDRFSLLYDYAFYQGYIVEDQMEGSLRLSEAGAGKVGEQKREKEGEIYRFWLRLYRRPIPHLTIIVKWIDLLCHQRWQRAETVEKVVRHWIQPFYYESGADLFRRILRMLMHLGFLCIGETESRDVLIRMNPSGHARIAGISGFTEDNLSSEYTDVYGVQ
ncbi:hypothetical protein C8P63_11064 [Melghirimyces profundicolus]|uniref:Uncharacterized protein n=1 Tax=Melghirimyces profundicolus TaxID=1242148 RepID=A0A2T6BV16_9BACL|nr:hypothetical protein [Melghirimyces profundicolus]PTX59919.1 hypothetical protein C8P63_11064 [Melghirimyces profundicolus]